MKAKKIFYRTKRTTIREMMAWAMKKEKLPPPTSRIDKEQRRSFTKPTRRWAVGYVRAFVGPHFFAGCYPGAEFD